MGLNCSSGWAYLQNRTMVMGRCEHTGRYCGVVPALHPGFIYHAQSIYRKHVPRKQCWEAFQGGLIMAELCLLRGHRGLYSWNGSYAGCNNKVAYSSPWLRWTILARQGLLWHTGGVRGSPWSSAPPGFHPGAEASKASAWRPGGRGIWNCVPF